ncbi:MAG: tetratricopeptide repeat protein, partial [Bacteroidota bacterium]
MYIRLSAIVLLLLFACSNTDVAAQSNQVDSLLIVLKTSRNDTNKVNRLNELAEKFRSGDPTGAMRCAKLALALSQKLQYKKGTGISLYHIASLTADDVEQLKYLLQALEVLEQGTADNASLRSKIYRQIGEIHFYQDNFDLAQKNFEISLDLASLAKDSVSIGRTLNGMGNIHQRRLQPEKALEYYEKALKYSGTAHNEMNIARILGNMGNSL